MISSNGLFSIFVTALVGSLLGLGFYAFNYGAGFSYLSNDPAACKNCHIMNDQFDSWRKGPHHSVATCNDCHVPQGFFAKYLAKAENGYHHSKGFTLQDFSEPIRIKEKNANSLQANCLRCHQDFVHEIVDSNKFTGDGVRCVHCHRGVGHGATK